MWLISSNNIEPVRVAPRIPRGATPAPYTTTLVRHSAIQRLFKKYNPTSHFIRREKAFPSIRQDSRNIGRIYLWYIANNAGSHFIFVQLFELRHNIISFHAPFSSIFNISATDFSSKSEYPHFANLSSNYLFQALFCFFFLSF